MFCLTCGTQLPEDANYCLKCGRPQKPNVNVVANSVPIRWETCKIQWIDQSGFMEFKGYFEAKAIGSKGIYTAAKTGVFQSKKTWAKTPDPDDKNALQTHERLVAHLVKDGWEPVSVPDYEKVDWFKVDFRRQIE